MKIKTQDIPCAFCGAESGEPCRDVNHAGVDCPAPGQGYYHARRIADVMRAEDVANTLLGTDQAGTD